MQNKKKVVYTILFLVCVIAAAMFGTIATVDAVQRKNAQEQYEQLAAWVNEETDSIEEDSIEKSTKEQQSLESLSTEIEEAVEESNQETETAANEWSEEKYEKFLKEKEIEIPEKELDWDALAQVNEDIYAWLYIPDTKIDFPVLQSEKELDYYLHRNLDLSKGYPACIYSQYLNQKDFTDPNTILYGHNMRNGTMFADLHKYEDASFFAEHPYIYIYTPERMYVYEIYASAVVTNDHLLYAYDFEKEKDYDRFITTISNVRDMISHTKEDMTVTYRQKLLTLSTCVYKKPDYRYIVTGVLIE